MNKEILKEIACYIGCIVFIAVSAHFGGLLKLNSYKEVSTKVVLDVKSTGIDNLINHEKSPRKKVTVYKNYRPRIISNDVLDGSVSSGTWRNIFNSNRKVVFYLYDNNDEFHSALSGYFSKNKLYQYYNFEPYSLGTFNNMLNGTLGPSKICNSLEECNKVRTKAANYTILTNYLSSCGKTMCIIDPSKNQYIRLKKRNAAEAEKMLDGLKNW